MAGEGSISFTNELLARDEVIQKIESGDFLVIAGDEKQIKDLPSGNWMAGSIPYFMTDEGGTVDQDKLYVNTLSGINSNRMPRITTYDEKSISRIAKEAPDHGFTIVILPAGSKVHTLYAQDAPEFENMFFSPIIGWIAGTHLNELGSNSAKTGFGLAGGVLSETQAVAMHVPLTEQQVASIKIVNLFKQNGGADITFPEGGFSASECTIDGQTWKLQDYIKENNIDTRLPLVADYSGVMVNVSIQELTSDGVNFYAPIFPDVKYHFASPVSDYVSEFESALKENSSNSTTFYCNCILNFLYSELEGKKTGDFTGPITFGEVAYQLLNQTMVYLSIDAA